MENRKESESITTQCLLKLDHLLVGGFLRKPCQSLKLKVPQSLNNIVKEHYHTPPVFDANDYGKDSVFQKLKGNVIRKKVDNWQYSHIFLDGDFYYGLIKTRFRVVDQGGYCCDTTFGIMEQIEYKQKYVSHSEQEKQINYRVVAGYHGYTGCMDVGRDDQTTELSKFDEEEAPFKTGDVIDMILDFKEFQIEFRKNDILIHRHSMKEDTVYKISVNIWECDATIELL